MAAQTKSPGGLSVFSAMWVNHRACFRSGPRHIHSSDVWVGKVVT